MNEKELKKILRKYAKSQGYQLNPNEKITNALIKGLLANKEKHGEIYCPCRVISGNKEEDKKNICPCSHHKKEIREMGHCLCNLFIKK